MIRRLLNRAAPFGAVLFGAAVLSIVSAIAWLHVQFTRQAPFDVDRVAQLQKLAQRDPDAATKLAAEQKRQTEAQQDRRRRYDQLSLALLTSTVGLVLCVKARPSLRARTAPSLARLVQLHLPAPPERQRSSRRLGRAEPSRADVDALLAGSGTGTDQAIQILQSLQSRYGYLPTQLLLHVCEHTRITPAQVAGVSTFYKRFRHAPIGRKFVQVCHGTACHVAGAQPITDEIRRRFKIADGADTDANREITLDSVACLGCCSLAPVLMVDDRMAARMTPSDACALLDAAPTEKPA